MSVLSLKITVICDNPNLLRDRTSVMPGTPDSSVSNGNVTSFSISSGASAGTSVFTCTWMFVMSGTASIGSRTADHTPPNIDPAVASRMNSRCRSENSMTRSIIRLLSSGFACRLCFVEAGPCQDFQFLSGLQRVPSCVQNRLDCFQILLLQFHVGCHRDRAEAVMPVREFRCFPQLSRRIRSPSCHFIEPRFVRSRILHYLPLHLALRQPQRCLSLLFSRPGRLDTAAIAVPERQRHG